jgi:hypothetical protein
MKNMFTAIRSTYQKTPFYFRWLFFPIKLTYRIVQKFRINIWLITGKDSLNRKISIIYSGSEKHKNYLANLAFDDVENEIFIGRWLWNFLKITKRERSACSLMVLEINKAFRRLFDNEKTFFVPCWISGEIDISIDTSSIIKTESLKSDIRRIRKNNLQFELATSPHQFDSFYNEMYLPYITFAHGNRAIKMKYSEMKKQLKNCDLLLIKKEKDYIGGILIIYENNVPRMWSAGIKDGSADFLKVGVMGALYYYSVTYLKQKGYKKLHFGNSRAFLEDGVLQYKKKWGLKIVDSTKNGFLIMPLSFSIVTKEFFINNPFIYAGQDGFTGAIFLEKDRLNSEKYLKRIYKIYNVKGISNFDLYLFGDQLKNVENNIPADLSDKVTIRSAENLF